MNIIIFMAWFAVKQDCQIINVPCMVYLLQNGSRFLLGFVSDFITPEFLLTFEQQSHISNPVKFLLTYLFN